MMGIQAQKTAMFNSTVVQRARGKSAPSNWNSC